MIHTMRAKLVQASLPNSASSPPIRIIATDAPVVVVGPGMLPYRIVVGESFEFTVKHYRFAALREFFGFPAWRWSGRRI